MFQSINIYFVIAGIVGTFITVLWVRLRIANARVRKYKNIATAATQRAQHSEKIATVTNAREATREERVEEKVNEAVDNNFDDFYR